MRYIFFLLFAILCGQETYAAPPRTQCILATELDRSFVQLRAEESQFDCHSGRIDRKQPRIWVKMDKPDWVQNGQSMEVQSDAFPLDAVSIFAVYQEGTILSKRFSAKDVASHWRPENRFGLPIPAHQAADLQAVYVAVDRPWMATSISQMEIKLSAQAEAATIPLAAMFSLLLGMMIIPVLYNVFFYGALRNSFLLWHAAMVLCTTVFTFSSSGLVFLVFPQTTLYGKLVLNYGSLAMALLASCFFIRDYVERNMLSKTMRHLLAVCALFLLFSTAYVLIRSDNLRLVGSVYYHAAVLPVLLATVAAMAQAAWRGSRAIWFQIFGWLPIFIFGFDRVARGTGLYEGFAILDYGLYFGLVMETMVIALGVADRIMTLRKNHRRSLKQQARLSRLAETDGLTSLPNRRGFENIFARNTALREFGRIALLDIDYFKRINDTYGHAIGDDVLRAIGAEFNRLGICAMRIGGEEFVLLLEEKGAGTADIGLRAMCKQLTAAIAAAAPVIEYPVSASMGVVSIIERKSSAEMLALADAQLYKAKNNGRNLVVECTAQSQTSAA